MHKQYKTTGIILKRVNSGEADRFITVFTKEKGKISVYAKGVRKINSKRGGSIELLSHSSLSIYEGKTHYLLTETENLESFPKLRANLKSIALAYHVCEIVDKLTAEQQENQEIYRLLLNILRKINNVRDLNQDEKTNLIRNFEIDLLKSLGFLGRDFADSIFNTRSYIEELIEKELKSKHFLEHLQKV